MNAATSIVDMGVLYGNSREDERRIRTYVKGLLRTVLIKGDKIPIMEVDYAMVEKYGDKVCNRERPCVLAGNYVLTSTYKSLPSLYWLSSVHSQK
jgi:hypothetical protein